MSDNLTPYGLGKYSLAIDAYLHSLECDEETGNCNESGWYGLYLSDFDSLVRGFNPSIDEVKDFDLSAADVEFLANHAAAIACEDSQGFVSVEWFKWSDEARERFAEIEAESAESFCDVCERTTDECICGEEPDDSFDAESDMSDASDMDEDQEPSEPEDGDYTTTNGTDFYQYGRLVLTVDEDEDRNAAITAHMDAEQFWPDAWVISDHGNACLIDLNEGSN